MGILDIFNQPPPHVKTYYPAANTMNLRLRYDTKTGVISYRGRFGVNESFNEKDIVSVEDREVSSTHHVIIVQGENKVLATFDLLPLTICYNMKTWLDSRGAIAYDYTMQQKGILVNLADESKPYNGTNPRPAQAPEPAEPKESPLEQIRQLKELFDIGAITEEEFQKKRTELLDRL